MADTPKIEVKPKELTEAEKAAQAQREKTPEEVKKEQEQAREEEAQKVLKETKEDARADIVWVKAEIPPQQLADRVTIEKTLGLKIEKKPEDVPAYLDFIAETYQEGLREKWFISFISEQIQKLLEKLATRPDLSGNRDWMNALRQGLNRVLIDSDFAKKLTEYSTMEPALREQLQKQLGIENITESLDANTRDIVQKVHTGFYRYDPEVNTWVNSVGALVFLWPENIAGIKKYLDAQYKKEYDEYEQKTRLHPNEKYTAPQMHPFLSVTDYHSSDKAGKYAIISDGRPHNMFLAEADYLAQYIKLRAEGRTDTEVFSELGKQHVANLTDNKSVQDAIKQFEKKYGEWSFNAPSVTQLYSQNQEISRTILPSKIPDFTRIKNIVDLEQYEYIVNEQRPEMREIIYDIAAGFVRFDEWSHTFKTVTGQKLRFTEKELNLIDHVFSRVRPESLFLKDTQILTYTTNDRDHHQYDSKILRERINFYQQ